jgi:hypothetical protein
MGRVRLWATVSPGLPPTISTGICLFSSLVFVSVSFISSVKSVADCGFVCPVKSCSSGQDIPGRARDILVCWS